MQEEGKGRQRWIHEWLRMGLGKSKIVRQYTHVSTFTLISPALSLMLNKDHTCLEQAMELCLCIGHNSKRFGDLTLADQTLKPWYRHQQDFGDPFVGIGLPVGRNFCREEFNALRLGIQRAQ